MFATSLVTLPIVSSVRATSLTSRIPPLSLVISLIIVSEVEFESLLLRVQVLTSPGRRVVFPEASHCPLNVRP